MQNLFNYSTLDSRLERTTRTLFVTLNRPDQSNSFNMELLFELESLLSWCTSRVEINSIFFDSSSTFFSKGLDKETLPGLGVTQLEKISIKLQKIIFSMMQLPQTIIMDVGQGVHNMASEFLIGADIRIAKKGCEINFNHSEIGLIPSSGGMSMLSTIFGHGNAKNWLLSGLPLKEESLLSSGFIQNFYELKNRQATISTLLQKINEIAPIQRIQTKLGLFETIRSQIEVGIVNDRKISKASLMSEDWKKIKIKKEDNDSFMPAKSMSYAVKLSLIKSSEESQKSDH